MAPADIFKHVGKRTAIGLKQESDNIDIVVVAMIRDLTGDASSVILTPTRTITYTFASQDDETGTQEIVQSDRPIRSLAKIDVIDPTIEQEP